VIERAVVAAAAIAIAIATGSWIHSVRLEKSAQSIAERPPQSLTRAHVDSAVRLFQRALAHNPDTRPIEREAGMLIRTGRAGQAIPPLRSVVDREPDNLTAWVLIAIGAQKTDPALAREATARARALNPLASQAR
jgi:predicted Zn-dependent protease